MQRLVELTNEYINIEFTRFASLEDLVTKQASVFDELTQRFAKFLYFTLNYNTIVSDFTYQLNNAYNKPSGAAPLFDAIFYNAYSERQTDVTDFILAYINDPKIEDPQAAVNIIYSEVIPTGLILQVNMLGETISKNGIDPADPKTIGIFNQLSTINTDINTSQICSDLKSYILNVVTVFSPLLGEVPSE